MEKKKQWDNAKLPGIVLRYLTPLLTYISLIILQINYMYKLYNNMYKH